MKSKAFKWDVGLLKMRSWRIPISRYSKQIIVTKNRMCLQEQSSEITSVSAGQIQWLHYINIFILHYGSVGKVRGPGDNWAFPGWTIRPPIECAIHRLQQLQSSFHKPLSHKSIYDGVQAAVSVSKSLAHYCEQPQINVIVTSLWDLFFWHQKLQEERNVIWSPGQEEDDHNKDDQLDHTVSFHTLHGHQPGDDPGVGNYHHQQGDY